MYPKSHANPLGGSSEPQPASNLAAMAAASSGASERGSTTKGSKTASTSQADKVLAMNSVERERMANVEQII